MATIQNVVSTCKISENYINLHDIPEKMKNAHYNPTKFNAAIIKIYEPKATILLFSSGRFVCTGTKNICDNKTACENICRLLGSTCFSEYKIHNVVGSGCVGHCIDLIGLANTHKHIVQYESEIFPGAKIKYPNSKATALIFTSGKIIVTGLKNEAEVHAFYNKILNLLHNNTC